MCIALFSSEHPAYSLILLSNRDEYLNRPAKRADWWDSPLSQVLGGRDLQRSTQGTWLGITRQGRIAVLTNFREENQPVNLAAPSRGEVSKGFLGLDPTADEDAEEWARKLTEENGGVQGMGGFSLIFGRLGQKNADGRSKPLGLISNRTPDVKGVVWVGESASRTWGSTCALSNSHFGDQTWPKVAKGEELLHRMIDEHAKTGGTKDELLEKAFGILSTDTLPQKRNDEDFEVYSRQLRNSIFIPPIGGSGLIELKVTDEFADPSDGTSRPAPVAGAYGTQKQTVILVDRSGRVTFVERTLYDDEKRPLSRENGESSYEFDIEGWQL